MPTKHKPGSLTTGYKKQHGIHHKYNNKYLKVYWPYIPLILFVIGGILTSLVILGSKGVSSTTTASSISLQTLLNSSNSARENNKLQPFTINPSLTTAAQIKANDMAINNYYSLNSPSGETPWQIIKQTGYSYQVAGENLAYGFNNSTSIVNAWLSSSKNTNLLSSGFNNVGYGIAQSPNFEGQGPQTIIVAIYASPAGSADTLNGSVASGSYTTASIATPHSVAVTRVETLTNNYQFTSVFIIGTLVGVIACYLILRHTKIIRKWALEGETLVINHPYIDFILIIFIIGLASLSQTVGIIG